MNRILILMYHIVAEPHSAQEARYCCMPRRFEAQMRYLRQASVRLLTLVESADAYDRRAEWPDGGVAVTFDDGFADTFTNALPARTRYRIPATTFAVRDLIGASNDCMARRGLPMRRAI